MTAPSAGPCVAWEPIWCEPIPVSAMAISGSMLEAATQILWAKSGRQFGLCSAVIRPCAKDCFGGSWPYGDRWDEWGRGWPYPYNAGGGLWFNLGCGGCPGTCSCTVIYEAQLPGNISAITEIKIDGVVLSPTKYRVYDYSMLIRTDGSPWPRCNDLNLDDTAVGTWSVAASFGVTVPVAGQLAVGELARELMLACTGDGACMLPSPVQQLVRQGVSMTFLDPNAVFADGKIGLYFSDLFLSTFNPGGIAERARVYDVDGSRGRRQTWPP